MNNKVSFKERIRKRILFESKKLEPYLSDKLYLQIRFWLRVGYWPDLNHPRSFNEKLNWLKLHDIHPEYTKMVDKAAAKDYVASVIGKEYIIPTLGIWDSADDIDWDSLPEQFVLKNTGDSGGIVVCKDKNKLDKTAAIAKLQKGVETDYYKYNKEYPYRDVKNRIIAEAYMEDESGELRDYKFFCFNGQVRFFKIDFNRFTEHRANYYSSEGEFQPFGEVMCPPKEDINMQVPINLKEMIRVSNKLSKDLPFIRVDLYSVREKIFFGELTFFPASGMGKFIPKEWDFKIGELLKLPNYASK